MRDGPMRKRGLMSWIILLVAGLFEVGWAVGFKLEAGPSKPLLLFLTVVSLVLSMALLSVSMRELPLGTAYAVWTGIGVLGTFLVGVLFFHESVGLMRMASVMLILVGLLGLKLAK